MFKIGTISESEIYPLSEIATAQILNAIVDGLQADRLVEKALVDFEKITVPGATLAFKISYPHTKDRAAIIQLGDSGQLIKIYIESDRPKAFSGADCEFLIYPTHELSTAKYEDIVEYVRIQLFMFAFILLKLSSGFDFLVIRDKKKLKTDSPAVALYETCINTSIRNTILSYNEPEMFESSDIIMDISKDKGILQISGDGVSSLSITLTEILANIMTPPLTVEYIPATVG